MLPDRRAESVDIAVSEHPGSLTLPVFEPPGIIDGKPMERELKISVHAIIRNPSRLPSLIPRVIASDRREPSRAFRWR